MANTLPTTMEYFDNLLGEQLTDGGGGGGGDFTTAQITVNDPNERGWSMVGAFITNNPEGGTITEIYTDEGVNPYIVLYKGVAYINFPSHGVDKVSVSGNAEIRTPAVRVTGDCTITIS